MYTLTGLGPHIHSSRTGFTYSTVQYSYRTCLHRVTRVLALSAFRYFFNKYYPAGQPGGRKETPVDCQCRLAGNVLHHTYPLEYQICSSHPRQKSCWASPLRIQPLGLPQICTVTQPAARTSTTYINKISSFQNRANSVLKIRGIFRISLNLTIMWLKKINLSTPARLTVSNKVSKVKV